MTNNPDTQPMVTEADYSEQALADRCIDFLEERADAWMEDGSVQRMFNAIASVFESYAPQEIMDRFREKLGVIGRQCHVEGALRVWEEIAEQQRALGHPLPADREALAIARTQQTARSAETSLIREGDPSWLVDALRERRKNAARSADGGRNYLAKRKAVNSVLAGLLAPYISDMAELIEVGNQACTEILATLTPPTDDGGAK